MALIITEDIFSAEKNLLKYPRLIAELRPYLYRHWGPRVVLIEEPLNEDPTEQRNYSVGLQLNSAQTWGHSCYAESEAKIGHR